MASWLILLILFPFICGLIGWVTNVLAVKMIFRPHAKVRILGIAFQGVLPKHQRHFARLLGTVIQRDFITTGDLVGALDQPETADRVEAMVKTIAPELIAELRAALPEPQQAMITPQMAEMMTSTIIAEARKNTPKIVSTMKQRANDAVDMADMIADNIMLLGPQGLERIIYSVAKRELTFIEYYGGIFGFGLGLLQWLVLQLAGDIALPVVGALVGTVTNWLAIQMLFKPEEPQPFLGGLVTYQGMFPKRQHEIAGKMGHIAATDLIIPSDIFAKLADTLLPETIDTLAIEAWEANLRQDIPQLFQVADALVPAASRPAVRKVLAGSATRRLGTFKKQIIEVATEQLDIYRMLTHALQNLKKSEFGGLLRGLFEREEGYLIVFGGLLGCAIGALQLFLVSWVG